MVEFLDRHRIAIGNRIASPGFAVLSKTGLGFPWLWLSKTGLAHLIWIWTDSCGSAVGVRSRESVLAPVRDFA